jgi:pSer/pThr/pTyr-binding forkhead associated (FHA) protein
VAVVRNLTLNASTFLLANSSAVIPHSASSLKPNFSFCLRVCHNQWYDKLLQHDALVTKRLYFHALEGLGAAVVRGAGDITMPTDNGAAEHVGKTKPVSESALAVALAVGTTPCPHIPRATTGDTTWMLRRETGSGPDYISFTGCPRILVGRSSKCDLILTGTTCSRRHALLVLGQTRDKVTDDDGEGEGGVIRVQDLKSMYGTWVRDTKVEGDQWTVIAGGDAVRFGTENTGEDAGLSATYRLLRETTAGEVTTALGNTSFRAASGNGGLLRPAFRSHDAANNTSAQDELTGTGRGHKPAKKRTGATNNVLQGAAIKKPRPSRDEREGLKEIALVAAAEATAEADRRRDVETAQEAARRTSQTVQASDQPHRSDLAKRDRFELAW